MAKAKRILFTGGSGKAGRHVVPYLLERGHRVVNVDLVPLDHPGVDNLLADMGIDGGNLAKMGGLMREASDMQRVAKSVGGEGSEEGGGQTGGTTDTAPPPSDGGDSNKGS